jgi:hypothetical protein
MNGFDMADYGRQEGPATLTYGTCFVAAFQEFLETGVVNGVGFLHTFTLGSGDIWFGFCLGAVTYVA